MSQRFSAVALALGCVCLLAALHCALSFTWNRKLDRRVILEDVREIIRTELEDQAIDVTEQTVIDTMDGWDSVAHVQIIVAVEARFSVRFEPDEYMEFQSVGEIVDCVSKKLARLSPGQS